MGKTTIRELVGGLSESVPGTSIAAAGFGLALYAYETRRMSSVFSVAPSDPATLVAYVASLAIILVLAFVYKRNPRFRLHRHPWAGFALAGTLAFFLFFSNSSLVPLSPETHLLANAIQHMGETLLLLCWVEVLLPLPSRAFATLTTLAMLVLSLANGLSGLLKQSAVLALIAFIPLLSIACLYWFKDKHESFDTALSETVLHRTVNGVDAALLPSEDTAIAKRNTILLFFVPLVGYPFVFGHIHYAWIPFQDENQTSLAIQIGAAVGTALGALLLLVLIAHFWGRRKIDLYSLIILPVVGITLYLTSVLNESWVFLYVIPLNICQKTVLFLAMLTPYLIPSKKSPLTTWCTAFFLYTFGKALSTLMSSELESNLYVLFVIVFVVALITSSIAGAMLDDSAAARKDQNEPKNAEERSKKDSEDPSEEEMLASTCRDIARAYCLTRRESEIFELLAQGMTAGSIAEELVISTSTAKTHMRNIYQKMGIHTQNELLLLVHHKQ